MLARYVLDDHFEDKLADGDRQLLPDCPQVQALLNFEGERENEEERISPSSRHAIYLKENSCQMPKLAKGHNISQVLGPPMAGRVI